MVEITFAGDRVSGEWV